MFLKVLKFLFTVKEKSGLWSDTGPQAPLVNCYFHNDYRNCDGNGVDGGCVCYADG